MGFDKDEPGPVVNPHKKTTQVNLWMVAGVILFFVLGGIGVAWVHRHASQDAHAVNQQLNSDKP